MRGKAQTFLQLGGDGPRWPEGVRPEGLSSQINAVCKAATGGEVSGLSARTVLHAATGAEGAAPSLRFPSTAIEQTRGAFLSVHGGENSRGAIQRSLHVFHFGTRTWSRPPGGDGGPARAQHVSALMPDGRSMVVFGGLDETRTLTNDVWVLSFDRLEWTRAETQGTPPCARRLHSGVRHEDSLYVFGGFDAGGRALADFYELNLKTMTWKPVEVSASSPRPAARGAHAAVVHNEAMFMIWGAEEGGQVRVDMWEYRFFSALWFPIKGDEANMRECARPYATLCPMDDRMIAVGGALPAGTPLSRQILQWVPDRGRWLPVSFEVAATQPGDDGAAAAATAAPAPPASESTANALLSVAAVAAADSDAAGPARDALRSTLDRGGARMGPDAGLGDRGSILPVGSVVQRRGKCLFLLAGCFFAYVSVGRDDFAQNTEISTDVELLKQPREAWRSILMRKHPEILELRERAAPLLPPAPEHSVPLPDMARTFNRNSISTERVLALVVQHLRRAGLRQTAAAVVEEANLPGLAAAVNPTAAPPNDDAPAAAPSELYSLLNLAHVRLRSQRISAIDPDVSSALVVDYDYDKEVVVRDLASLGDDRHMLADEEMTDSAKKNIVRAEKNGRVRIKAASTRGLIEALVPYGDASADLSFMKEMIVMHPTILPSRALLQLVLGRYEVPRPEGVSADEYLRAVRYPVARRVVNLVKYWLERSPGQFDDRMHNMVTAFIDGPLSRDGFLPLVYQLRLTQSRLQQKSQRAADMYYTDPPEPRVTLKVLQSKITLADLDDEEVARQLSLMDFELYAHVTPQELLAFALDDEVDVGVVRPVHLQQLHERAQAVSRWASFSMLEQEKPRMRKLVFERMVRVALQLIQLHNFFSLIALLDGLMRDDVVRWTPSRDIDKSLLSSFQKLSRIVPRGQEMGTYRSLLRKADLPCMPYVIISVSEIRRIASNMPDKVDNLHNIDKRRRLYKVIDDVLQFQKRPFHLQPVHQIQCLLQFPGITSQALDALATQRST